MDPAHPALAPLRAHVARLAPLGDEDWAALAAVATPLQLERGEHLLRDGDPATRVAVVLEGLLRHYYVDARGREAIKAFRGPLDVSAPYAEILLGRPSRTHIQALVPTRLVTFDARALDALAARSLALGTLARRFVELHFVMKEQREFEFLQLSAEERYRRFCAERPEHLADIPLHQVASYIGITPVALSRIRARKVRTRRPAP
jgi:CRP-like cAMP-binding protein